MSFSDYDLKDLGKIITGRTPSSAKVSQAFSNIKGTPFLTPRDMDGRRLIRDTERYLTSDGLQSVLSAAIPAHSISVSCIGSDMGKAVINDIESVTNQQINTIVPNEKIVNYLYLYYVLSSKQEYLKSIASGSATPILNKTAFGNIKIKLPSIGAQQKIAKILGDLDKKIEINNQINETLEAMAQAIYKSWFVDFDPVRAKAEAKAAGKDDAGILRAAMAVIASKSEQALAQMAQDFPDEYKKLEATAKAFPDAFVESELGLIPEGWEISSLGKEYNITMGQSPKGESYNEEQEGILFFQGRAEFGWRYPTPRLYTTDPKRMAQKGDVLMSVRAPVGDFNIALEACCIGRGLSALRHKSGSQTYSFYQLLSLKVELDRFNGEGTVFGSINQTNLKNMQCLAPDDFVIDLFLKKFSKFDELIKTNALETISLTELRDSLLPKLLSGEIEV